MLDAAPLICVAVVVVVLIVGWVLGRRRAGARSGNDLVADQLAARADQAPPADLERRLRELLIQRQKIQAVKLLRDHTGASLTDASDAVDRMDNGQPLWLPDTTATLNLPQADLDQVRALKRQGKLIEAIKTYRQLTGLGLKEAKDAVDLL
ncbi:hypothetical protein GCM10009682_01750 [Luedemannella flava]|uniref:Large ribosomal subunit protein bL12 C-terminal domain-containing protein n=1 Tax=Luedemannella flava TaxID=349316 RepID=A0ABP4XKW0_9ACTN